MTKFAEVKYSVLTEEPCFVLRQFKHFTLVRRPVMSDSGIKYKFDIFFNSELETLHEQTQRTLEQIKERNKIAEADMQAQLGEVQSGPFALQQFTGKKGTN